MLHTSFLCLSPPFVLVRCPLLTYAGCNRTSQDPVDLSARNSNRKTSDVLTLTVAVATYFTVQIDNKTMEAQLLNSIIQAFNQALAIRRNFVALFAQSPPSQNPSEPALVIS